MDYRSQEKQHAGNTCTANEVQNWLRGDWTVQTVQADSGYKERQRHSGYEPDQQQLHPSDAHAESQIAGKTTHVGLTVRTGCSRYVCHFLNGFQKAQESRRCGTMQCKKHTNQKNGKQQFVTTRDIEIVKMDYKNSFKVRGQPRPVQ